MLVVQAFKFFRVVYVRGRGDIFEADSQPERDSLVCAKHIYIYVSITADEWVFPC